MRRILFGVVILAMTTFANLASAQQTVWVQIKAQRSLGQAQEVARQYAANLQNVSGFATGSGWYAIALGPFTAADAADALLQLRVTRQIPNDSYIVDGSNFRRQFWPIGAVIGTTPPVAPNVQPDAEIAEIQPLIPAEETVADARRAERQLGREDRMLLQTALQWEGFYASTIDGAIGPGTRGSMAAWQLQEGLENTGVLTTAQRHTLVTRYQDMLTSLGMAPLIDATAGIKIDIPTTMVNFDRYDPPFAHFKSVGDDNVQLLLISQSGDEATLRGLYDIMQTLEVVPLDGARNISRRNFTLTGEDSAMSSYTYAALADGHVKGFTLIWNGPPDKRQTLVVNAMKASFEPLGDTVLPDVYGDPNAAQALDLLAGLDIRQPDGVASGFYVDQTGTILTSAHSVASCARVIIDDSFSAEVSTIDQNLGLALLRPSETLAPLAVAQFLTSSPRLNSEIALSGYSFGGLLGAPSLTYGTLSDLRGLDGNPKLNRLAIMATSADAGGPVYAATGAVLGMLLPVESADRKLPEGVRFAAGSAALSDFLTANEIQPLLSPASQQIAPEDLTDIAANMTVLVSCWN